MIRPLTVAGAAQAGPTMFGGTSLLPVELRHVNHTASTNGGILRPFTGVHFAADQANNSSEHSRGQ